MRTLEKYKKFRRWSANPSLKPVTSSAGNGLTIHLGIAKTDPKASKKHPETPLIYKRFRDILFFQKLNHHIYAPAKRYRSKQKKKPGNPYKSRLPGNGGISRAQTYDLHDVKVKDSA